MAKVVVLGLRRDPVADVASFLRERGIAAAPVYVDSHLPDDGLGASISVSQANETHSSAPAMLGGRNSGMQHRTVIAVCWGRSAAYLSESASEISAAVVIVLGSSKQEVISACVASDAEYAVLWPKERELLVAVVRAAMGAVETTEGPDAGPIRVGVSSVKSAGATLLAGNLASVMTSKGKRVLLVDSDTRCAELTELLADGSIRPEDNGDSPRLIRSASASPVAEAIYACTGNPFQLSDLLAEARSVAESADCDLVLTDIPEIELDAGFGNGLVADEHLFDRFLLVVPLDYFGLRRARKALQIVDAKLAKTHAAVVFCSYRSSGPSPKEALELLGNRTFFEMPWIPEEAGGAIDEGRLIVPSDTSSLGFVFDEITRWLVGEGVSDFDADFRDPTGVAVDQFGGRIEWQSV